jgi:hypothetical protein
MIAIRIMRLHMRSARNSKMRFIRGKGISTDPDYVIGWLYNRPTRIIEEGRLAKS